MARLTAIGILSLTLFAASPASASAAGVWTVLVENDIFYNRDRNYTNGVALVRAPGPSSATSWASRVARSLPLLSKEGQVRETYRFGQNMYTPRDIKLADPPVDDRPYAGWLYATVGLGVDTGRRFDQFALTLGMVGPASLAEQGQKLIHRITGVTAPRGWDTQLGNEPGIVLTYDRNWRGPIAHTLGLNLDGTPHIGGALGNVSTYAHAGWTLRYGNRLPLDYGPPRIQPSVPASGFFERTERFSWYLFAGFEARAVARNIFLDGNTFARSRRVDKEPLVGDLQGGLVVTWRSARLSYTHILRTTEFKSQDGTDEFGAVSLSMSL
jgi:lipid A 3-O-deacylase